MTPHSIPVFLGNAGIGLPHGMIPPQIRGFDVYYKSPILVGFHVLGDPSTDCCPTEFSVQEITDENMPQIVGFYCYGLGATEPCCTEPNFSVEVVQEDNSPKVIGFYAIAVSSVIIPTVGLMAQISEDDKSPKVLGFYAIGVT